MFNFELDIQALSALFEDEKAKALSLDLPDLAPKEKSSFDEFNAATGITEAQQLYGALPLNLQFRLALLGLIDRAKSPYHFSALRDWLELETWTPKQALLLLAGVSPDAAKVDWTYKNFAGVEISRPKIRMATVLNAIHDTYDVPERDAWDDDICEVKRELGQSASGNLSEDRKRDLQRELAKLEALRDEDTVVRREKTMLHRSNILAGLSKRWFSGDHDVAARNFPSHFIGWAAARGFYPEWFEWAKSSELIDASEEVYRAPFFDPDQPDYPVLLHIAVRAWEAARVGGTGTPKQRIERFVSERYPALKATTRELIAQIANWERTGGRPRQD